MSELNQFHRNQTGDLNVQKVLNVLNNLNNLTTSPERLDQPTEKKKRRDNKNLIILWTSPHLNVLIHDYFGVDIETVWETVKADIPKTKVMLARVLENAEGKDS
jgi:hypothetical protein